MPDVEFGERLVLVVEMSVAVTVDVVSDYLRERIAHYKVPREVLFLDSLPREDSGKIKKRLLRDAFRAGSLTSNDS